MESEFITLLSHTCSKEVLETLAVNFLAVTHQLKYFTRVHTCIIEPYNYYTTKYSTQITKCVPLTYNKTQLYSIRIQFRKLCIGVKYYIVHMYSMPYYTYGSTANFLFLGPKALI